MNIIKFGKHQRRIVKATVALAIILFFVISATSCTEPPESDDYDVYRPEILDDGKPDVEGTFWEIVDNPEISLKQKVLIEAYAKTSVLQFGANLGSPEVIEGLGITDLNALKGVNSNETSKNTSELKLYSTRLNDISILKDFTHLKVLSLRGSEIIDFTPISKLHNLTELDISYSKANDLSALVELINLETLIIDKESNFSLTPIKHLMNNHLNSENKTISLKVVNIKGKLKETPTTIGGNSLSGKVTPKLQGKYKLEYDFSSLKHNNGPFFPVNIDSTAVGELILKETEFIFSVTNELESKPSFTWSGTYRAIGNLIYFKKENEPEYINSFFWSRGLRFTLVDRSSFENYFVFSFKFKKVSDEVE